MAMAMHTIPAGQYVSNSQSQYDLTLAPAPSAPLQQTQLVQAQRPQLHQTFSAPAVPTYTQTASAPAAPAQQVVQTRIVHVSSPRQTSNDVSTPTRQYVCFKNSRHLNRDGHQWENCEHITMSVSPDEIERSIRRHDIPDNDLLTCLGNMGVYRQRHVRRYEDKLNAREPDPGAWMWVLEALGELKAKGKSSTPHTFWAVFSRTSRNNSTQQSRIVRPQQVLVHHEPVNVVEASPPETSMTISHPQTYTTTTTTTAPQSAPMQQPLLALPAPPMTQQPVIQQTMQQPMQQSMGQQMGQQQATGQQSFVTGSNATMMPANSYSGASTPNYPVTGQWSTPGQNQAPASQPTYTSRSNGIPTTGGTGSWSAQRPLVHQGMPPRTQSSQQLALPAPQSRPSTAGRQSNQAHSQPKEYSRPLPGPVSIAPRNPVGLSPERRRNTDMNPHQYQVRSHSPPRLSRHNSDRWDDGMSDDSNSNYSDSSGMTSLTNDSLYELAPPKRRAAPLSRGKDYHSTSSSHAQSPRRSHESSRSRHHSHHHHHHQPIESALPRTIPEPAPTRPQLSRNSTFDVEIKTTSTTRRPAPIRRTVTDHPRQYKGHSDDDFGYDSRDELEERLSRIQFTPNSRGPPSTGYNRYEADGLVSYGSDRKAGY